MSSKPSLNKSHYGQRTRKKTSLEIPPSITPQKVVSGQGRHVNTEVVTPVSEWRAARSRPEHYFSDSPRLVFYPPPPPLLLLPCISTSPTPLRRAPRLLSNPILITTLMGSVSPSIQTRRSASMDTRRLSSHPHSQSAAAAVFTPHAFSREIHDVRELPSSQPVSLLQFCAKPSPSSRKAVRNIKSDTADRIIELSANASTPEACRNKPSSGLSAFHHNNVDYNLGDKAEYSTPHSQIHSPERSRNHPREEREGAGVQAWYHGQDKGHVQKNPLSYDSYYYSPRPRENSYVSESPFRRQRDQLGLDRGTWASDMTPASNRASIDAAHSKSYSQRTLSGKEYMATPSLRLYKASFDRPYNKSPYEPYQLKFRNRTDIPEITSGLQPYAESQHGQHNYMGNTSIRSEPTIPTLARQRLPTFETTAYPIEPRAGHISHSPSSQLASTSQDAPIPCSNAPNIRTSISNGEARKRTFKEEICAILDNMNPNANTDSKRAVAGASNATLGANTVNKPKNLQLTNKSRLYPSLFRELEGNNGKEKGERASHQLNPGQVSSSGAVTAKTPQLRVQSSQFDVNTKDKLQLENFAVYPSTPVGKVIKPPPGLPDPLYKTVPAISCPSHNRAVAKARLDETNTWFHKDSRGEEQLREHIADIAENYVSRSERIMGKTFSAQDSVVTKQTILLLGNAIANLHSYVSKDREKQSANFANFGALGSCHCESPVAGRRSYFDRDPVVDTWSLFRNDATSDYANNLN